MSKYRIYRNDDGLYYVQECYLGIFWRNTCRHIDGSGINCSPDLLGAEEDLCRYKRMLEIVDEKISATGVVKYYD